VSEELENSLQQAIENYLSDRLHAIEEQLARLQDEFNATFVRLREASASDSLEDTFLSSAIAAHLQAARAQKLSGAITPTHASESVQVNSIKRAVDEIERQQSQVQVLGALLRNAAGFAERVALFVVKQEQAIGWRVCEANDPNHVEAIPSIALPFESDTSVTLAARSRSASVSTPGTHSDDNLITDQLGGDPKNAAAVPLVVRGRVVAILYADSSSPETDAISLDPLETLTRVAAMAVDLISARAAQPAPKAETEAAQPALVEEAPATIEAVEEAAPEPAYTPQVEPQATEVVEPVAEISAEVAPETVAEVMEVAPSEFADEQVSPEFTSKAPVSEVFEGEPVSAEPAPETAAEDMYLAPPEVAAEQVPSEYISETPVVEGIETEPVSAAPAPEEPAPAALPTAPPSIPGFSPQYAAPLGTARRYGVVEPELPIGVGEEERRLHNDARRFARLLVSEIKLYNEPKVKEGRNQGDIYDRLRDDIDRSRQMYEKRVAPPVAARHDYFHQELVNNLAEGDPAKLGVSYPGELVSVS